MLSKKMAFSLMRLITLLALAFVAPSTMAADDFDATFSVVRVSAVSDHNAVYGENVVVTLAFGAIVDGTKATLTIFVEDKFGAQTSVTAPTITAKDLNSVRAGVQNDNKTFTFTIPAAATDANDVKVHLHVAKGVAEIVPIGSDRTSKEGKLTIDLVGSDAAEDPEVVSIELGPGVLIPAAGYTGGPFDVIITLSEKPKAFTKDHVDVSNATWGDPVELQTQVADNMSPTGRDGMLYPYVLMITPKYENKNDIVVKVKAFEDMVLPTSNRYTPPSTEARYRKGTDKLAIKVGKEVLTAKTEGFEVVLAKDKIIPNQVGNGVGTPGAAHVIPQSDIDAMAIEEKKKSDADTATAAKAADTSVMIPEDGQIYISEIMFAGGGFLPQWIEISNGSRTEQVNLSGWTLRVENATADADVFVSAKAKFRIPEGTRIDPSGQHATPSTLLVVTKQGRTNLDGKMADGQVVNLDISRPRYALLSDMAFKITLSPPSETCSY